jgi:hypothetical protein
MSFNILFVGCEKIKRELELSSDIKLVNENYNCIVACPPNITAKQKAQDEKIPYYECGITGFLFHIEPVIPFISSTNYIYCLENNKYNFPLCKLSSNPTTKNMAKAYCKILLETLISSNYETIRELEKLFIHAFKISIKQILEAHPSEDTWWNNKKKPIILNEDEYLKECVSLSYEILTGTRLSDISDLKSDTIIIKNYKKNEELEKQFIKILTKLRIKVFGIEQHTSIVCSTIKEAPSTFLIEHIKPIKTTETRKLFIKNLISKIQNKCAKPLFVNMQENIFVECDVIPCNPDEWINETYNINSSLQDFITFYNNKYKATINMIVAGSSMIDIEDNSSKKLLEFIDNNTKLILMSEEDIDIPEIHINITL